MANSVIVQSKATGEIGVRVANGAGQIVNRYVLSPGAFTDANTWADTDLSAQPQEVKDAAAVHWTAEAVNAWKAAHPYVPPAPPTAEQVRDATFKADPARVDMIDRLRNATPAQIDTYIDNNVTNLAQARTFLKALTKVLAIVVRD